MFRIAVGLLFLFLFYLTVPVSAQQAQNIQSDCAKELDDINKKISDANDKHKGVMEDLKNGLFCSECKRSKTEIEASGRTNFYEHIKEVKGQVLTATQDMFDKEKSRYQQLYDNLKKQFDDRQKTCNERIQSAQQQEQKDAADAQKRQQEEAARKQKQQQEEAKRKAEARAKAREQAFDDLGNQRAQQDAAEKAYFERERQNNEMAAAAQKDADIQRLMESLLAAEKMRDEYNAVAEEMKTNTTEEANYQQEIIEDREENESYMGGSDMSEDALYEQSMQEENQLNQSSNRESNNSSDDEYYLQSKLENKVNEYLDKPFEYAEEKVKDLFLGSMQNDVTDAIGTVISTGDAFSEKYKQATEVWDKVKNGEYLDLAKDVVVKNSGKLQGKLIEEGYSIIREVESRVFKAVESSFDKFSNPESTADPDRDIQRVENMFAFDSDRFVNNAKEHVVERLSKLESFGRTVVGGGAFGLGVAEIVTGGAAIGLGAPVIVGGFFMYAGYKYFTSR